MTRVCGSPDGKSMVQSLVFKKDEHPKGKPPWTPYQATKWARAHGYIAPHVEEAVNSYRLRQFMPQGTEAGRRACGYRTVPFGHRTGILGVLEFNPRRRR